MCKAREFMCLICIKHLKLSGLVKCSKSKEWCDANIVTIFFKWVICNGCDKKTTIPLSAKTAEIIIKFRNLPRKGHGVQNIAKREKKILPLKFEIENV